MPAKSKPASEPEATPTEEVAAAAEPFDPAKEPPAAPVLPPGWTHETLPAGVQQGITNGALEEERDRLREQVRILQHELERADEGPPAEDYKNEKAGTGHLVERLARVTQAMHRVKKRGYNQSQNYAFVAHADVLDAVRPALSAEGVSFASTIEECEQIPEGRKTDKGAQWCMWRVKVTMTFQCHHYPAEGEHGAPQAEVQRSEWLGFAQDYSDKGASKALTSAIKTFLIQQFLLSTGDDPDEPPADTSSQQEAQARPRAEGRSGSQTGTDSDIRAARNACMDLNQKLPRGMLGKIAKRVAGQGVIMKVNDVGQLQKIAKAAERYLATEPGTPEREAANDWIEGRTAAPTDDAARQAQSGEPDLPHEPVSLPAIDSYDPPLTEEEARQWHLNVNPRPEKVPGQEDF